MVIPSKLRSRNSKVSISLWALILTYALAFLIGSKWNGSNLNYELLTVNTDSSSFGSNSDYSLAIPKGKANALPSIRVAKEEFKSNQQYGGKGDKPHLGGFTDMDHHGVSPAVWKWMMTYIGVHSVLDVGCGRGISTSWFYFHGADVLCVEGSHDAIENTVIPDTSLIVEHDFSRGPWWPEKTYDAVWCVEFLEHVGRNFQHNYFTAFRKSAVIFASHSLWGGHHHVEVHEDDFWIEKMTMLGFVYSPTLTNALRKIAISEQTTGFAPNGLYLNAQHLSLSMQVFINPAVASLPQHAHLMAELGCYLETVEGVHYKRECGTGDYPEAKLESVLPKEFHSLALDPSQDEKWFTHVKGRVKARTPEKIIDPEKLNKVK